MYDYLSVRQVLAAGQSFCPQYYVMVMSRSNNLNLEELPVRDSGVKKRCTIKKASKEVDNWELR